MDALYCNVYLTVERIWAVEEQQMEVKTITPGDVQHFRGELCEYLHIEMLSHGYTSRTESARLLEMTENILQSRPLAKCELIRTRSLLREPQTNYSYITGVLNAENVDSFMVGVIQLRRGFNILATSNITSASFRG